MVRSLSVLGVPKPGLHPSGAGMNASTKPCVFCGKVNEFLMACEGVCLSCHDKLQAQGLMVVTVTAYQDNRTELAIAKQALVDLDMVPRAQLTEAKAEIRALCVVYHAALTNEIALKTQLVAAERELHEAVMSTHLQAECISRCGAILGSDISATIDGLPRAVQHIKSRSLAAESALESRGSDLINAGLRMSRFENCLQAYLEEHNEASGGKCGCYLCVAASDCILALPAPAAEQVERVVASVMQDVAWECAECGGCAWNYEPGCTTVYCSDCGEADNREASAEMLKRYTAYEPVEQAARRELRGALPGTHISTPAPAAEQACGRCVREDKTPDGDCQKCGEKPVPAAEQEKESVCPRCGGCASSPRVCHP